jgi:uncharacterized protein YigE (DUF2233 family)
MIDPLYFLHLFTLLFPKQFDPALATDYDTKSKSNVAIRKTYQASPNFARQLNSDENFTIRFRKGYHVYSANSNYTIHYYVADVDSNVKILPRAKEYNNFADIKRKMPRATFMMNAGMFHSNYDAVGLLISNGQTISALDTTTREMHGNFYMYPNGVFYFNSKKQAYVLSTAEFRSEKIAKSDIQMATQSGPMLLIDSKIHPSFSPFSKNVNIRNGVGVTQEGKLIFAISESAINFYDFALFFRDYLNCPDALYLDGAISDMYYEGSLGINLQKSKSDGKFGPVIVISE